MCQAAFLLHSPVTLTVHGSGLNFPTLIDGESLSTPNS
jgi:hypothetical protein